MSSCSPKTNASYAAESVGSRGSNKSKHEANTLCCMKGLPVSRSFGGSMSKNTILRDLALHAVKGFALGGTKYRIGKAEFCIILPPVP